MLMFLLPCSTSGGGIQHVATCKGGQLVHCGQLPAAQVAAFKAQLASVMAKVAERKGDARAQVDGRQGHQKTPAMVRAAAGARAAGSGGGCRGRGQDSQQRARAGAARRLHGCWDAHRWRAARHGMACGQRSAQGELEGAST